MSLHALVEASIDARPDATAVIFGQQTWTYKDLEHAANRWAHTLIERGVRVDDVVGICLDRSFEMIVAILATLKCGAAYLPLDPHYPAARSAQIIAIAGAGHCFVQGGSEDLHELSPQTDLIDVDATVASSADNRPSVPVRPENIVSVYFTSGSTGAPKGVASTHTGWVNRMTWMQRRHRLSAGESVLHKTTLTFDDAALEIFWPLAAGGRVAVLEPGAHRDPRAILRALRRHGSVYLQVVPSMLTMMIDTVAADPSLTPQSLRATTSSGEALMPATVRRFHELMPGTLHNTWGATEVSIDSTHHLCNDDDALDDGPVCVGRPFDNNEVQVLDDEMRPVPAGATAELYIGGVGLARGYLGDPARTAESFRPHPHRPGERLYRTGDRGSLRPDGAVTFAGRNDFQVKIRGMRVELGEIEAVLRGHDGVREAVVLVHRADTDRLVAFVVGEPGRRPDADGLRTHASGLLPRHMVPDQIVPLARLPLTSNGKIDRGALRVPARDRGQLISHRLEPCEGPVEPAIAAMCSQLLSIAEIGATDDLVALGADSLTVVRLTVRLRERYGVEVAPQVVFAEPTVRRLAEEMVALVTDKVERLSGDEVAALLDPPSHI